MKVQGRSLILALAIALWAWQTQHWWVAIPAAVLLILPEWLQMRWEPTFKLLCRLADLALVTTLGLAVLLFVTQGSPRFILSVMQWLPIVVLPLALTLAWSSKPQLPLKVLPWNRQAPSDTPTFDIGYPYSALWILAAGTAATNGEAFFAGVVILAGCALFSRPPWRPRLGLRLAAFALASILGFWIQTGLHQAQKALEDLASGWLTGGSAIDPYRSVTDIGHIGALKNSDALVLRVTARDGKPPRLLHRASYNSYFGVTWHARGVSFSPVPGDGRWVLNPQQTASRHITIHDHSRRPNPVLSLPTGTTSIEDLSAESMKRNPMGAVQIDRAPGFFSYQVAYNEVGSDDQAPNADDLKLPPAERQTLNKLVESLGLNGLSESAISERVQAFFADGYRYSLYQDGSRAQDSPITDFLLRSKAGHCEYFATATTLLLRAAGIPARYATGFAVLEYSRLEEAWVVRVRHTHAWVRAYVGGQWVDIDTTPPSWMTEEQDAATSPWSALVDAWNWAQFRLASLREQISPFDLPLWAWALCVPFLLALGKRLYRSRRAHLEELAQAEGAARQPAGSDSELYMIEARLSSLGMGRQRHESTTDWFIRLQSESRLDCASLGPIIALHYRYRFDPQGLAPQERSRLSTLAKDFLRALPPSR